MNATRRLWTAAWMLAGILTVGGCGEEPTAPGTGGDGAAPAASDLPALPPPEAFVSEITNPYLALAPGKTFRYTSETEEGLETIVVEVERNARKIILGVSTTVVHDRVYLDGDLIEDTFDWFAQDEAGNVWYFGEDSKELLNGVVISTEGSWEAGKDGAQPGILMLAEPRKGMRYQQELAVGVAEDMAQVMSLNETVEIPYGTFEGCLETMEWTPLAPGNRERKFYAPGIGKVLELPSGGGAPVELTEIED